MVQTRSQTRKRMIEEKWIRVESAQGVFIDILSRLSVESIRSFKTVSKYWRESMSSKYFAKLQITQSKEHPSFIACPSMDKTMDLYSLKPKNFKLVNLRTIDMSERSVEGNMHMISSFNGLICCKNWVYENELWDLKIWICNPCTGETLLLPQGRPSFGFVPIVGVAYGSDISDYKVFRIFSGRKKRREKGYMNVRCILRTLVLRKTSASCLVFRSILKDSPCRYGPVFVGGKIYWISSLDGDGEILSVDWEGKFEVINLPEYAENLREEDRITEHTYIINLQGSLSVVVRHVDYMDIWAWRKDGENFSWVHEIRDTIPFDDCDDLVLAMTSSKNLILCMTKHIGFLMM